MAWGDGLRRGDEDEGRSQIRGAKTIHIGDRSLLDERDLERYFTGGHRNVDMPDLSCPGVRGRPIGTLAVAKRDTGHRVDGGPVISKE